MIKPIELVIFDCDGVLVDIERIAARVQVALGAELGWPLTEDDHKQAERAEKINIRVAASGWCGGPAGEPRVATAGATPTATAAADTRTAYVEAMRKVVKCLRDQGVKVSDPDAKGRIVFEGDNAALKNDPKFGEAQQNCRDIWPTVPEELLDKPPMTREQIETARQYAKCMRANGAPDFPDPGPDGYYPARGAWKYDTPAARQAEVTCGPIIGTPASPGEARG